MSIKMYLNLGTTYQELENLDSLKITQNVNEHGKLFLTAVVQEEAKAKYATDTQAYEFVEIVADEEDGNSKTVFKGVVTQIEVREIKKQYYLFVTAKTGSYKTDLERRSRSFQNKDRTYTDLLSSIVGEYAEGILLDTTDYKDKKKLDKLTVQYKETDWNLLKRLASQIHAVLVPSLIHSTPKIIMGIPQGIHRGEVEKYNYSVTKDLERFFYLTENGTDTNVFSQLDAITFHIEITEDFEIGDQLVYYDRASNLPYVNLYVKAKEIEMVEGVLNYRYDLATKRSFYTETLYNEHIAGVSIKGTVLERIQDTVKVQLHIDTEEERIQDIASAWQFPYTTPYTAADNGGWYVMPEVGDVVFIYFPDKEEAHAVGMQSVREGSGGTDKIGNPAIKYLRTADGKEIKLAPDEVVITCSNWVNKKTGEHNKIYIQLQDGGGITIQSTKPIYINSDADINFSADSSILLAAEDAIRLRCKSSLIQMDSSIEVVSGSVKVN